MLGGSVQTTKKKRSMCSLCVPRKRADRSDDLVGWHGLVMAYQAVGGRERVKGAAIKDGILRWIRHQFEALLQAGNWRRVTRFEGPDPPAAAE